MTTSSFFSFFGGVDGNNDKVLRKSGSGFSTIFFFVTTSTSFLSSCFAIVCGFSTIGIFSGILVSGTVALSSGVSGVSGFCSDSSGE